VASRGRTAEDVMTTRVFAVRPQTSVRQIADLFEREFLRRVPVVEADAVVGIVSRANLVQALASAPNENVDVNLNDTRVRDLVVAEYRRLPGSIPAESNITVRNGVVHLWGRALPEAQIDALRIAAAGIPGVKRFQDHTYRFLGDIGRNGRPSEVIIEPEAKEKLE